MCLSRNTKKMLLSNGHSIEKNKRVQVELCTNLEGSVNQKTTEPAKPEQKRTEPIRFGANLKKVLFGSVKAKIEKVRLSEIRRPKGSIRLKNKPNRIEIGRAHV